MIFGACDQRDFRPGIFNSSCLSDDGAWGNEFGQQQKYRFNWVLVWESRWKSWTAVNDCCASSSCVPPIYFGQSSPNFHRQFRTFRVPQWNRSNSESSLCAIHKPQSKSLAVPHITFFHLNLKIHKLSRNRTAPVSLTLLSFISFLFYAPSRRCPSSIWMYPIPKNPIISNVFEKIFSGNHIHT